ncbi:4036_t:CDS:2, partial [Scutellospora calospora]
AIIAAEEFEIQENIQKQLENAIIKVKKSPEMMTTNVKEFPEILEYQKYLQQLKDFDNNLLKYKDFNMTNLVFDIIFSLANSKTEIFSFIEKFYNTDLENETNSFDEIDKYLKSLPEWSNYCTEITNQFEDLNNLVNNILDSVFIFEMQEKLLTKMDNIRKELCNQSEKIDKYKSKKIKKINIFTDYEKKINQENEAIYLNFIRIIELKLVYDSITELKTLLKRLKLLDSQKILATNNIISTKKQSSEYQLGEKKATKEEISIPLTKIANEKRNSLNQDYTTGKVENNNSNLVQKTNTLSSDSKLSEPKGKTVIADTQKNKKRKNKKGTHENNIVMTEATTSGQGSSSH